MLKKSDFLHLFVHGSYRNCSIEIKFYMDKLEWVSHIHTKFQLSRSTGSLLVCCKMLQKCSFLHLFVHGSYQPCSVEVKLSMDKLGCVDYMHTKFQVSMSTGSLLVCCKILRNCNFLHHCVHGSYKNCSIEMKFHTDKLG